MSLVKTDEEIKIMTEAGKILAKIMKELAKEVKPGITTNDLNRLAESLILSFKVKSSFKGYENFPASLCVSVNEELVHSVPSERKLKDRDIVSLDLGIKHKGYHADMAITVPVGDKVSPEALRLIRVAKKALKRGIRKIRSGVSLGDIGNTVQRYVESQGYDVVRDLCGHGIGKEVHEEPQILNYGKRKKGAKLAEGMTICLEPMLATGDYNLKKSKDGFGYETKDGSLCAHFEHTILVTKSGAKILTEMR